MVFDDLAARGCMVFDDPVACWHLRKCGGVSQLSLHALQASQMQSALRSAEKKEQALKKVLHCLTASLLQLQV